MIEHAALFKQTGAYKIIANDKKNGKSGHAYLLLSRDGAYLREYLKILAEALLCGSEYGACGECRVCRMISEEKFTDVKVFPESGGKLSVEDVENLIEDSFTKPLETDYKVFIIADAENLNPSAQNKLLKTLEEPPEGVKILLGAVNEYSLLPTVLSRVKTLTLPPFTDEKLIAAMKGACPDKTRLERAVACGDGTVGRAEELYSDARLDGLLALAAEIINGLNFASDVLICSEKMLKNKDNITDLLGIMQLAFGEMLTECEGGKPRNKELAASVAGANYSRGAIIYAAESTAEALKRKTFFVNDTMLAEWLLFRILEGKHRWQK